MTKFRVMSWLAVSKDIEKVLEKFNTPFPNGITPSCLSCSHFNEDRESCAVADYKRPPARIIAFGCDRYDDSDDIPF